MDSNGDTGLIWTIFLRWAEGQVLLLETTPNTNVDAQNKDGQTALLWAVIRKDAPAIIRLRNRGANAKLATRAFLETPLMVAASEKDEAILSLVLEFENKLEDTDKWGRTALMRALQNKRWVNALHLGDEGANMDAALQTKPFMDWLAINKLKPKWLPRRPNPILRWCARMFGLISDDWDD